jgi:acyl-CoA thioesterase FadM
VVGHGVAVIEKPPIFLKNFFNKMKPQLNSGTVSSLSKVKFNYGKKIKDYTQEPKHIFDQEYKTTLENSNLIGNIYFSNYPKWINSTKDLFLYSKKPGLFCRSMGDSEFFTYEINISHLQEAMPFDQILVRMFISELYEKGVLLKYEIFKKANGKFSVKLATAKQVLGFSDRLKNNPRLQSIPADLIDIF